MLIIDNDLAFVGLVIKSKLHGANVDIARRCHLGKALATNTEDATGGIVPRGVNYDGPVEQEMK